MSRARSILCSGVLLICARLSLAAVPGQAMTLARLQIPGTPEFAAIAKDVLDVKFSLEPDNASSVGLYEDCARVPSYSTASIAALSLRLKADIDAMKAMPWKTWPVDQQIDFRWVYANARAALHELSDEKMYLHRPAEWLGPVVSNLINLWTYVPQRADLREKILSFIPPMVAEMRAVVNSPTSRDTAAAEGIIYGLRQMLQNEKTSVARDDAMKSLDSYAQGLDRFQVMPDFQVIGADNYAWVYRHALLLPWTPQQLLAMALRELHRTDAELAALKVQLPPKSRPTPEQTELAKSLTREKLLALYSEIAEKDLKALEASGEVTIPKEVGPIYARETPEAMLPLTGDGGSMNAPPIFGASNIGYWNVEHFHSDWPQAKREEIVVNAQDQNLTGMGPYGVHEGIPGHHLQLSIARLNPDPLRSILADSVQNEGWALYAEEMFWRAGGLGPSVQAHYNMLESWRSRIRRVVYDVNINSGLWTLQQAADYKSGVARPGEGLVDEDIMRAINWPAQLIGYFAGKMQIVALREDYRKKMGAEYTDRKFHDALLAVGSIPYVFARSKLLGEPVPDLD